MARIVCITAFFLTALAPILTANEKEYHSRWLSRHGYIQKPFPLDWRPAHPPKTETDVAAFEKYDLRTESFTIPAFVARYGIPQRYLVSPREKQCFLIYDLPSGHYVELDVYQPPEVIILAAAIRDSRGKLILLIK
jgi:hypothetical protein